MMASMLLRWLCVVAVVLAAPRGAASAPPRTRVGPLGFAMTADAGSRLVVPLASRVAVEERRAATTITYVLRGARVRGRNDTRALVTAYFNTPVSGARLVPRGRDVHVVIELRAATPPVWRLADRGDGTAALEIDFAAGTFATPDPIDAAPVPQADADEETSALWRHAPQPVPARREPTVRTDRPRGWNDPGEDFRDRLEAVRRERQERRRAEQKPRIPLRKPAPQRHDPGAEERARAFRERKQAEREAVRRKIEAVGNTPGGYGTATSGN